MYFIFFCIRGEIEEMKVDKLEELLKEANMVVPSGAKKEEKQEICYYIYAESREELVAKVGTDISERTKCFIHMDSLVKK